MNLACLAVAIIASTALTSLGQTTEPIAPENPAGKKAGGLLDFKKITPPTENKFNPVINLTQIERFQLTKGKAEAGDSQAQYELSLLYLQESERTVPLDYFEAYNWMVKAATKNHRMAQFHLGRLYENGLGTEKNNGSALEWRRSAALLGCKQSQRWMGLIYLEVFSSISRFSNQLKTDPSNLIEAYAWFNLGSEIPFPPRLDPITPGPEELATGNVPLNLKDYNSERSIPTSAARDRDQIARRAEFTQKMLGEAKARSVTLAKEALEFRSKNKAK